MGAGWSERGVEGVPLELVYRVLQHVSLRDLTTLSATSKYLRNLVDESPLLWSHVHTQELWPNENTWNWFNRAAQCGNVGASIKLAVALLYNEGVVLGGKPVANGELAVNLFEKLETGGSLWPRSQLWLLYRPPWGAVLLCCKRYVHTRISHIAQIFGAAWAARVLSRIAEVTGENEKPNEPLAINWVKVAASGGDTHARLLLWRTRYEKRHQDGALDPGTELQASRELRELCLNGYYPACLTLAHFLASSRHSRSHCLPEVREFFQSSPHSRTWSALNYQQYVTPHMHHVLVDWLCEVANMKLHASKVFHAATQIVEAYLNVEQVKCHQLQLVGITAVLLATRFIPGASILTIREASWVTDNTYTYNHVVRTIGHILAALKANLAFPTILDYATVLLESVRAAEATKEWTKFLCDMATTCTFPPRTTLAQIGCSCVLLGYILSRLPWPNISALTGFSQHQLYQPALIIYSKCFDLMEGSKCRRLGIIDRYSMQCNGGQVGTQEVPPLEDLLTTLELSEADYVNMVAVRPKLADESGATAMETDTVSSHTQCNGLVYKAFAASDPHKTVQKLVSDQNDCDIRDRVIEEILAERGGGGGNAGGDGDRLEDVKMDCSDGDIQELDSIDSMEVRESQRLRTGACHSAGEAEVRRKAMDDGVGGEHVLGGDQAIGEVQNPEEVQEVHLIPREEALETQSETTSSEESLSQTCEDGELVARVSLKRKLENASSTNRPEKCLILDVGKLQLD